MIKIPKDSQSCVYFRIKCQFIPFSPDDRHWNTLTMLHGKLERGPEEVVPWEVVPSAPPSKYLYQKHNSAMSCFILFFLNKWCVSVRSLNENKLNKKIRKITLMMFYSRRDINVLKVFHLSVTRVSGVLDFCNKPYQEGGAFEQRRIVKQAYLCSSCKILSGKTIHSKRCLDLSVTEINQTTCFIGLMFFTFSSMAWILGCCKCLAYKSMKRWQY